MNAVITPSTSISELIEFADAYLANPDYTELAVNVPGTLWTYGKTWESHDCQVTETELESLATAVAVYNGEKMSTAKPIMTASLHGGERIHITRPPVTKGHTVTIRKPSSTVFTMDQYTDSGFFEIQPKSAEDVRLDELYLSGSYREFLTLAVQVGKTVVVSGSTGSGKTSFLRSLLQYIPAWARVITGEDVAELACTHANHVPMFFHSQGKQGDNSVTPDDVLRSALRMLPSRIVYGELRGGEALAWLQACNSGHTGSLVTVHANSGETIERLCVLATQAPVTLPYASIDAMVRKAAQVIVHIEKNEITGKRSITEVVYTP